MTAVRAAFDPAQRLNPGKIYPRDGADGEPGPPPAQFGGMRAVAGAEGPWI
jgi:hypothetical protein